MRAIGVTFVALAAAVTVLAIAQESEATAQCQPTMPTADTCQGISGVGTTTGGTLSGRCFYLTTLSTAPACSTAGIITTGNQAWELAPGACTTLYYHNVANGAVPPATPNKVSLYVSFDDTSTVIKILHATTSAAPTSGDTYTFCATSDGISGSAARAGSVYLGVQAIKDNGNGLPGNTNYNVLSNGVGTQDTSFDIGFLRGQTTVASITNDAASLAAYGPAGNELITVTSTFTPPFADANRETSRNGILDEATLAIGEVGATVDFDGTGTFAQSFTVDNTYPAGNSPYVALWSIQGNAYHGLKGTVLTASGHGAGLVRDSDTTIHSPTDINIDPRIRMDSDGSGGFASADETDRSYVGGTCSGTQVDLFNRGESACTAWSLVNARDEYLTRSMSFVRRDSANTVCSTYGSLTPTAAVYSSTGSFGTGATCLAAADTTGSTRHLLVTNTDQSYTSGTIYFLSSLYFIDAHPQLTDPLVEDDYPTEDASEDLEYFIRDDGAGGDDSDTVHGFCHVVGVRKDVDIDTSASAVTGTFKNPSGTTIDSAVGGTDATGWTTHLDLLANTPLGTWTWTCAVTYNGNTANDIESFTIGVEGGGGETVYTGADPLTIFGGNVANGSVPITVHSRLLDGEARVGVADQIFVSVYEWPSMDPVVTGGSVVEVDATNAPGAYVYNLTFPGAGAYLIAANTTDGATPIGAHNVIVLANGTVADILSSLNGHRTNSLEILGMSFNDLEFDGFLTWLVWLVLVLFFLARSRVFAAFVATLGLAEALFPTVMPGSFLGYVMLLAIGVWIEAVAGEKIYQTWLNKNPKKDREPQ